MHSNVLFGKNLSIHFSNIIYVRIEIKSSRCLKIQWKFLPTKDFLMKNSKTNHFVRTSFFPVAFIGFGMAKPMLVSMLCVRVDLFGIRKAKRTIQRKDREKNAERNQQSYYIEWQRLSDGATHKGKEWENSIEKKQSEASLENAVWIIFVGIRKRHATSHKKKQKNRQYCWVVTSLAYALCTLYTQILEYFLLASFCVGVFIWIFFSMFFF